MSRTGGEVTLVRVDPGQPQAQPSADVVSDANLSTPWSSSAANPGRILSQYADVINRAKNRVQQKGAGFRGLGPYAW